jgi:hypothetical protein
VVLDGRRVTLTAVGDGRGNTVVVEGALPRVLAKGFFAGLWDAAKEIAGKLVGVLVGDGGSGGGCTPTTSTTVTVGPGGVTTVKAEATCKPI